MGSLPVPYLTGGAAGLESLCLERVEQVGCGRLGGQLPGVDLAGVQADQVQVGVGEVGAGEQERQPVPAAGGARPVGGGLAVRCGICPAVPAPALDIGTDGI